ncbi:MAG: hypothetical protein IPF98_20860 [Gemmatimonadetes bacterium]|jgi:hypothetical protein|nr:hypothetical protein [Gemmatimonadota bacterium]MCC6774423.1 hypothetical protein [Gemmatimonadaceae bacterium]
MRIHLPRRSATRRLSPRLIAVAAVVGLTPLVAACRINEAVSTTEPVTGPGTVYALVSANDISLPATFTEDASQFEIRQGALTLATDSTFIFSLALRVSVNGSQASNSTSTLRGTFGRVGNVLTLRQQTDTLFLGTYSPNSVSLQRGRAQVAGDRFVFAR